MAFRDSPGLRLVTALLWLGLSLFSSIYFSSVIISDSLLYGTIGVVFTFLTWFILVGGVIVLGTAGGAVWQLRQGRGGLRADSETRPNHGDEDGDRKRVPRRDQPS
jgi:membrane protein